MTEGLQGTLRTTSDELMADLEELLRLEDAKRGADPGSDAFVTLARRVTELSARVLALTGRQEVLAERANHVETSAPGTMDPIEETPRPAGIVLAAWRDAERRLAATAVGSGEAAAIEAQIDALRREYQRAFDAARRATD